ncbi:unnamed protein product [Mytilus edulis]|uniref:SAP domain-containing protein n=1 Tax=Mytilus edulis TaxID=6550 RepID=A0A8S3RKZ7_MYTED|nr:unnamed protein product [Mytilus edulis]
MDPGDQNTSLEEFKTWKTDNLQHYLTMRGLTKEGTKDELVALCFSAAKLGQTCNHVASLLFKLESSNRYGMGACTSSACSWVVPKKVKDMQPKLLASMPPRKSNRSKSVKSRTLMPTSRKSFNPITTEKGEILSSFAIAMRGILPNACIFRGIIL